MKTLVRTLLVLLSLILLTGTAFTQGKDKLIGTWEGEATLQSQPQPNTLTLKMEMIEEKLSGNISGQFGMLVNTPLNEIKFKNDSLSFKLELASPSGGTFTLVFKMEVKADEMEGELEVPELNDSGIWTAVKKKEEDKLK
ncbi:hypothetical protein ACFL4T_06685 [candidate division KSB1 bacterium]